MIKTKNKIVGTIKTKNVLQGVISPAELRIYPELEDLEITPSSVEQNFKSEKYGYDNVKVKAIETEEITITPKAEEQIKEGIFNKVTVQGDENLIADNIKQGTSIFGVEGKAKTSNVKITDTRSLFDSNARLDILNELLELCDNVTNANRMFSGCSSLTELDLSNFDTSNVTDMGYIFQGCSKITNLNLSKLDTSSVKTMANMFSNCSELTILNLSNFNTENLTNASSMFNVCSSLTELDLSSFDMSKVTSISSMFYNCTNLTKLNSFKNLGKGYTSKSNNSSSYKLDLSACKNLTHDSLMSVINNLYDLNLSYNVANGGTLYRQSLVLGSTNLAKLTEEEIAIATNKGWNVS